MVKIFVTGATGYIGGDALYAIAKAHPEYEITCLVRNSDKGALVAKQYPSVRLVYGDLDSASLLTEESANADVVCHFADCDHVASAQAIVEGLSKKTPEKPGYLIHTSGTGILCFSDLEAGTYGAKGDKIYDDWDGVGEVTSLKDTAPHRNVDVIVLAAGTEQGDKIKTAIVCPPTIYGPGRGPGNQRSNQAYNMAKSALKKGGGFHVGAGENLWTMVHVQDLSNLYLKLVEEAVSGGGAATWGAQGYYFAENGEFVWGEVAKKIAEEGQKQGFIQPEKEIVSVDLDAANDMLKFGGFLWGTNSRARAIRARKVLGWTPVQRSLFEEIPDIVAAEAKSLGLGK